MSRTAEKVRSLVREDPELADVLEDLLDHEGEIRWRDVKGDVSSGQWGRLLEKDVLVESGEGFEFADPDGVREGLEPEEELDESPESSSWSKWDKLAAVGSFAAILGYNFQPIQNTIGGAVEVVLGPLDAMLPFYVVVMALAVLTGLYSTLLQANLTDMSKMSKYQERAQKLQDKMSDAKERGDEAEIERLREEQMEAFGDQAGMLKEQFRPMAWIMLLTIPAFLWMYWKLGTGQVTGEEVQMVLPLMGEVNFNTGRAFVFPVWIIWYMVCSFSFSNVIRKALNIQTTPT
ncbi:MULTISPECIES: DUF106 domain-containing protein [unclassified Halobacterium]|jgi:uncharacterized membrane protein (DUF106 family)|uniref:DUF106 domain-containing protein n=1 Tax=unclassified Halobacterium TaxID=2668073 RepID=UPI001E310DAD|nr:MULTISPECIES: DUF106 domain-containing protein [unclassified Halobacterium]MCD2200368.1 DUF106 domain-containing protein [Halobacterium sp. KA-4]MCD2204668.1 DUF106 domain-containing protein [Halobacterium sp. KA-6]